MENLNDDALSLARATRKRQYHIVFIPKYRRNFFAVYARFLCASVYKGEEDYFVLRAFILHNRFLAVHAQFKSHMHARD